jgi:hypothetical protein
VIGKMAPHDRKSMSATGNRGTDRSTCANGQTIGWSASRPPMFSTS